jgi:DNA repair ATPase RecN
MGDKEVRMKNKKRNQKRNQVEEIYEEEEIYEDPQEEIIQSLRRINKILNELNRIGRKYCVPDEHYNLLKEIHGELVKIANFVL